jgi:hypothetical protein
VGRGVDECSGRRLFFVPACIETDQNLVKDLITGHDINPYHFLKSAQNLVSFLIKGHSGHPFNFLKLISRFANGQIRRRRLRQTLDCKALLIAEKILLT